MAEAGSSGTKRPFSQVDNDEEREGVSMLDVLEEDEELEEAASAVLGGSDDQHCTYIQGYLPRQALYACSTCTPDVMDPAGVCLACSYECHEGHELYELYTKRNFRCDCGNSKFPDNKCKLDPSKAPINPDNKYNHNFHGLYCICDRPYPDPDDEIEDEMIQCVVCEDWYHGRHLSCSPPSSVSYQEMVCAACMKRCSFLWAYTVHSIETTVVKKEESPGAVDVESVSPSGNKTLQGAGDTAAQAEAATTVKNETSSSGKSADATAVTAVSTEGTSASHESADSKEGLNGVKAPAVKGEKDAATTDAAAACEGPSTSGTSGSAVDSKECNLQDLQDRGVTVGDHAMFWPQGWRAKLCTCHKCKALYEEKAVTFLQIDGDTVLAYEQRGQTGQPQGSTYEKGMEEFSKINRIQQVEVLHGYNDMKDNLRDYLKTFAEQGKVVTESDIKEFFKRMQDRRREQGAGVQFNCR
ncbi:putative E3 ubiquitin-protein ligase UBR7 [Branchiostoma lanceolatum]|uniref:putative E3 ubiquitin-protein ligase UBR7 n=1 Tax=Branchiostoma lanceolatum TaxID=7740 RepID=UPI0034564A69